MAGFGERAFADLFFGHEQSPALLLVGVLGLVGHQRRMALLDERGNVDDEAGADVGVERGVDDLEGAMGCERLDAEAGEPRKAGEEAGFIAEGRAGGVIRVARLPIRENHDAGARSSRRTRAILRRFSRVLATAPSGRSSAWRWVTPRMRAAASASAARSGALPRVPDSP